MKVLLALLVLIAVHYASAGFSQCYVNLAYTGTDSDCTADKPFPSIESALTYFYTNVEDASEGLDLVLFPGNYLINSTIAFQSPVNITYNESDDAAEESPVSFFPGTASTNVVAFSFPYDFTLSGPITFSGFDTAIVARNTTGVYGGLNDVTFTSLELSVLIATNLTTLDVNNVKANVITDDADDGNTFTVNNVDTFTIKNSIFTGIGGVAFVNVVSGGEIEDSTFNNTTLTVAAATIDTAVTITNSNFTNIVGVTAAVSISGSQQVYVEEITFQNNKNHFTLTNSFATIKDSLFSGNNETDTGIGGALYITANSIVTAEGTTWTLNTASANGGGVFVSGNSTFSAETSTFSNNTADNGAAIGCDGISSFVNVTAGDGNVFTSNVNTVPGGIDVDCSNINQTESQSAIVSTPSSGGSLWWVWVIVAIVVVIVIIIIAGAIAFFIYQRKRLSYDRME